MKILAFETSCDETGIALVEGTKTEGGFTFTTIKAELLSQAALHAQYGGVYPNLAKREHQINLPVLFAKFQEDDILRNLDAVAVTVGPGLEPALWQGIEFAKKVAAERGVPLYPANHMEGHLLSSLVKDGEIKDVQLPVLGLLVSGGHTEFVLMKSWFNYEIIGETLDDAVGECFDKVARMIGLPYPGGPHISKLAQQHREQKKSAQGLRSATGARIEQISSKKSAYPETTSFAVTLPRPMLQSGTCDVSFSGLKTAALYALRDASTGLSTGKTLTDDEKAAFAAEFEDAVADVFVSKTRKALEDTAAQTFVLGGGVAANRYLREKLQQLVLDEFPNVDLYLADPSITGDNAVMIAQAALARVLSGAQKENGAENLRAVGNLSIAN